jgi:hypothetical protein
MSLSTHPQAHFLVSVEASSQEQVDIHTMRSGLSDAAWYANHAGTLVEIGDESTKIQSIAVSHLTSPAAALVLLLAGSIADTPETHAAAERLIRSLVRQHPRERIVILSEDERTTLMDAMTETRRAWEASDGSWISDAVYYGYDGYAAGPDAGLLESAFCENPVFTHLTDDAMRLGVLRILAKPEVLDFICSPERQQPVSDLEEFDQHVGHAVWPMTAAERKSRTEDVLEVLQLHGLIRQGLEDRLMVAEREESEDTPRG